ncbi:hypothetical protein HDU92_006247 [Lobulomyces angularis]|nr:hypothetical protein HDU92_006247 [Lobulomyces angularis]
MLDSLLVIEYMNLITSLTKLTLRRFQETIPITTEFISEIKNSGYTFEHSTKKLNTSELDTVIENFRRYENLKGRRNSVPLASNFAHHI